MKTHPPAVAHPEVLPGEHPAPTEADIQKVAYQLWQEKGCPAGYDLDIWLEAKALLLHRVTLVPGTPAGAKPVQARSRTVCPDPVKAPAGIHFPTPHSDTPFPTNGPGATSSHLDFRHSAAPFQPSKLS